MPVLTNLDYWPLALVVAIISIARTLRLVIFDDFPPMVWVRVRILAWIKNEDSKWKGLLECPFCLAPYATAVMIGWMYLARDDGHLHWTWWLINGWWAVSYIAAIIVAYDESAE